jgi:hypothetical protein
MKKPSLVISIVVVVIAALVALLFFRKDLSKPISSEESLMIETSIRDELNKTWKERTDGCSLGKVTHIARALTGYRVGIEYQCGMPMPNAPATSATVSVSNSGEVSDMPSPAN